MRLWTACPWADALSPYDIQHLSIYNWLLNAQSEGVAEDEMARVIFGLDARKHPTLALVVMRSHLERARWVQSNRFPYLDW